jgi:hypothetical protein
MNTRLFSNSEFRNPGSPISHLPSPISREAEPSPDLLDSLVLQHRESQGFVNVNVTVNEDPEPYGLLINCFLFFAHLFPYVLMVALTVYRS